MQVRQNPNQSQILVGEAKHLKNQPLRAVPVEFLLTHRLVYQIMNVPTVLHIIFVLILIKADMVEGTDRYAHCQTCKLCGRRIWTN